MSGPGLEAVLGGTFDPVHLGHLEIARTVRRALNLPRVLLLPTAVPPHKEPSSVRPIDHRLAMLRQAIERREGLQICTLELDPGRPGYTIESMRRLREGPPPCRPVFILGMDALIDLPTWRSFGDLLREFDLLAIDRIDRRASELPRGLHPDVRDRLEPPRTDDEAGALWDAQRIGQGGRVFPLRIPPIEISSSEIRRRAAAGDDLGALVPPEVARYIHDHALYRDTV